MHLPPRPSPFRRALHGTLVTAGALAASLLLFMLLPVLQAISETAPPDLLLTETSTARVPPPPPPPIEEEPPPEEAAEEIDAPDLSTDAPPLDLGALELALDPGAIGDGGGGSIAVNLSTLLQRRDGGDAVDELVSSSELDQKPRALYQPMPNLTASMRKKAPGSVFVIFTVDETGKVVDPKVKTSSDPVFEAAALAAIKRWKFEPAKRNGRAVRFGYGVPMTFPKGD